MTQKIVVIKGDGIGPEIMDATLAVLDGLDLDFEYEFKEAGLAALESQNDLLPQDTLDAISTHGVCLKGPLTTPVGKGFSSINVAMRRYFKLYANVRPVITFPGTMARYENIDILTVRENTEGAYLSEGQTINAERTIAESKIIVTREASENIVRYAFDLAQKAGRKKVTAVHKANIMKTTSGLFLEVAQEVAKEYPDIKFNTLIVDNACMQLVMNPEQFDVIVTTNLFGDIISDICAGLVGGLGLAPGANIGKDVAMFEAVHGSAPDIAGKKIANPTSLILASAMMVEHLGHVDKANQIRQAITDTIGAKDCLTGDMGGQAKTAEFTQAVISRL
ncbi:isocitrate dehydrogenase [Marinicella gelatinilytica]|uniref:isocitrate dehydrogenase n=1 Tax=Marinicella gelatinilytica TaxID=2996017 RepID=UPI002260939A|nr:isocitrate dehydrogenase [Marinicella gelatinilytica]MCX7545539.1 isocitrate dehydrogenase [Marinicella gelatinilytica]